MAEIGANIATTCAERLVDLGMKELPYLCCYNSYVEGFEREKGRLSAEVESMRKEIEEAKTRNETEVDPVVQHWLEEGDGIIHKDSKPKKWFGFCVNCFSQYSRAKELESAKKEIQTLIRQRKNFPQVAHLVGAPGMAYHSQEFLHFESRALKFERLKAEIKDEHNHMIGLQGMGGTGKTTMAKEVGQQVESKPFDKVIFTNVSTPVDEKRIRDDVAKQLGLQLEEEKKLTHAQQIWTKIANAGRVLIILDDVWEKLNLESIGIQPGFHRKGTCNILLTTRNENVCTQMDCQKRKIIHLDALPEKDALNLFLFHAIEIGQDCPDDLKKVALDIVNECGRLPVIIVAVAKTLRDWPIKEWQDSLIALRNTEPSRHKIVDEVAMRFYNSLKLSYTSLKDRKAQVLFLLCSIFPKAYEIPVELLSKIAIGIGLFGEVDKYNIARSQVNVVKNKLINSSLLLKAGKECVKMHDVIHEVALEIANNEIEVIEDSKKKLKENMKYSSCIIDDFSNCFDGRQLEVLLIWINKIGSLKVPSEFFRSMKSLKVLLLFSKIEFGRTSALSLPKSIQSLKNIKTLSLTNWELGDISVLENLQMLETLELFNCLIIELPNGVSELKTLRYLGLVHCSIERNNPFEVITRCSQLEELYYVLNEDHMLEDEEVSQITSLPEYQRYHIDGGDFSYFYSPRLDISIKKSFKPDKLQFIFSKELMKSLATRAEILKLKEDVETGQNSLIPGIVSIEHGAMCDLIKLSLTSWSEIKCLVLAENLQLKSGVNIFSKLLELQLNEVTIREICCGRYPDGFLKQLEKLELRHCRMMEGALIKGKLELGNLKFIEIMNCSMTCMFHRSTAQTLKQLETLKISYCSQLKCILREEGSSIEEKVDDKDPKQKSSHESMFPKLKLLYVSWCDELEFILPICLCEDLPLLESVEISWCGKIKYIFGQYLGEEGLYQMQKEIILCSLKVMSIKSVPEFVDIYPECYLPKKSTANASEVSKVKDKSSSHNVSWGPLCCFLPQSSTLNKDDLSMSETTQSDPTTSQALKEEKHVGNTAHGIFTPPLYPFNLREMMIVGGITKLTSLFSVCIASSLKSLEKSKVMECDALEHIVTDERHCGHDDDMNANSIFPNLHSVKIYKCNKLESIFPASCSTNLVHLQSMLIDAACELKYVFGKSYGDDNSLDNHNAKIHLPALTKLCLEAVPKMVSMCPENYYVTAPSLNDISFGSGCPQLAITSLIDLTISGHKGQEQLSRKEVIGMHLCNLKHLGLESLDMETIYDLERLGIASPVNSTLKTLSLNDLDNLRNICVGPKNYLSFQNLFKLTISDCNQLKFILPSSISRSLPCLRHLEVSDCEELEHIIEDADDDDPHHQECCFPNLHRIIVTDCKRLKWLFSISASGRLPQLSMLVIYDAPELEQVSVWKRGSSENLVIEDYFPKLLVIVLNNLPNLHNICPGIDFRTVKYRDLKNCPKISLTSINFDFTEGYAEWFQNSVSKKGNMDEDYFFEQFLERLREVPEKAIKRNWPRADQNNGSPNIKEITGASTEESPELKEAIKANEINDSEECNKLAAFGGPSQIESPQSERGHHLHPKDKQSKPLDSSSHKASSQETTKPSVQEGSKLDEAHMPNQIMDLELSKPSPTFVFPSENESLHVGKGKRIMLDQQELPKREHDMPLDDSQKNTETSVGEGIQSKKYDKASSSTSTPSNLEVSNVYSLTSAKASMDDGEELAENTMANEDPNQRISPISTLKKPRIATSAIHTELAASSQPNMDISKGQIKVNQIETCIDVEIKDDNYMDSKQIEEDDLIRLFHMMREGADDVGVDMPCVPKIAAFKDDKVAQAFADLESLLKMDLNQIANSEEHTHRLENALSFLSTHCSEINEPSSHGLRGKLESLRHETQNILSSFKQASSTLDRFIKLEQRKKLIHEQHSQRMKVAIDLVSEISKTENRMADLKEKISSLHAELNSKEKEFEDSENKLSSLKEQKKKSVRDTIGFMEEYEAVKKEGSHMVDGQTRARQELEKVENQWPSPVANLKKTTFLLGSLLSRKL